jgi:hypothetical protein
MIMWVFACSGLSLSLTLWGVSAEEAGRGVAREPVVAVVSGGDEALAGVSKVL